MKTDQRMNKRKREQNVEGEAKCTHKDAREAQQKRWEIVIYLF